MPDIEHVVVLMFENRSFDHMLGLLSDDPRYGGVRAGDPEFSNPIDPTDPKSERVMVSDDARPDLATDPSHSHASVMVQLGRRLTGAPTMEGFILSYARKVESKELGLPVVHWERISALAAVVVALLVVALALPTVAPLLAAALGVLAVMLGLVTFAWMRRQALRTAPWHLLFLIPPVVVVALSGLSALLGHWFGYPVRLLTLAAVLGGGASAVVRKVRKGQRQPPPGPKDRARQVMRCMNPDKQLPALATLARSFALCTRWHCSVPGATWPNRNFAHAGTSDGTVDIEIGFYDNATVFQRLTEAGATWAIYHDPNSLAQAMAFEWLTDEANIGNWRPMADFADDVAHGRLPAYTFIEPCHDGPLSNSQHPGNNDENHHADQAGLWDFQRGENLLIEVYEALRANPALFDKTLLVVTYDEHGGLYDHVRPPTDAVAPEPLNHEHQSWMPRLVNYFIEQPKSKFRFDILGPRVPTVVIGPRVPAGPDPKLYDHTAIPATVRKLFAPKTAPLSAREAVSPTFEELASLPQPRTDLPDLRPFLHPEAVAQALAAPAPARRQDEFAQQLSALGAQLGPKLAARQAAQPAAAGLVGAPPPAGAAPTDEAEVAALFAAHADAARRNR
ncbi:MAG TPA: alkaline phosphatase family protein [Acidimicrobiales bacterium]|nr:alkaline phosphatase family protein [Acidimicrobiales bacterium]